MYSHLSCFRQKKRLNSLNPIFWFARRRGGGLLGSSTFLFFEPLASHTGSFVGIFRPECVRDLQFFLSRGRFNRPPRTMSLVRTLGLYTFFFAPIVTTALFLYSPFNPCFNSCSFSLLYTHYKRASDNIFFGICCVHGMYFTRKEIVSLGSRRLHQWPNSYTLLEHGTNPKWRHMVVCRYNWIRCSFSKC